MALCGVFPAFPAGMLQTLQSKTWGLPDKTVTLLDKMGSVSNKPQSHMTGWLPGG